MLVNETPSTELPFATADDADLEVGSGALFLLLDDISLAR